MGRRAFFFVGRSKSSGSYAVRRCTDFGYARRKSQYRASLLLNNDNGPVVTLHKIITVIPLYPRGDDDDRAVFLLYTITGVPGLMKTRRVLLIPLTGYYRARVNI